MTTKQEKITKSPNKRLILKYLKHTANISLLVAGAIVVSSSIVFTRLSHHKEDLQLIFKNVTGIELNYTRLDSGFTMTGMPFLKIHDLILSSPVDKSIILKVSNLDMIMSYRSILNFAPIFNKLSIDNTKLNIALEKNDDITLNGFVISNLNEKSSDENNLGYLINQQDNIDIKNIKFSIKDNKHNLKPLDIDNYSLHFDHSGKYSRQLIMSAKIKNNEFISTLEYDGFDTLDYRTWVNGELSINAVTPHGYKVNLHSLVVDHQIDYIKANLNSNDNILSSHSNTLGNITAFNGNINIFRNEYNKYTVDAKNLSVNTDYGYLFKNASIKGNVDLSNGGSLDIRNLQLDGINCIINYITESNLLSLSGNLSTTNIYWFGDIHAPRNISLNSSFSNVNLISYTESIPSFTNLSGSIRSTLDHGEIKLKLNNSKITASKYLYQPIHVNSFDSMINWHTESDSWKLSWENSTFITPDFAIKSDGTYHNINHQLKATASTKSINLSQIYKYLPKSLDKVTINSLSKDLSGYINNLNIGINGNIDAIPFKESDTINKFNITGELKSVNYNVIKDYPKLENINGKFQLNRNQILDLSGNASFAKMSITANKIQIPNIIASSPVLLGNVLISGSTDDLLQSINETPYKKDIAPIIDNTIINGNGKTTIDFKIPLNNPEKFTLSGKHLLQNNDFLFKNESIPISNVDALVSFNQNGLLNGKAQGSILNSIFDTNISKKNISINFPQFNYSELIDKVSPALESTIVGKAKTTINYSINDSIVKVNSDLKGVYINAPEPFDKLPDESREFIITAHINNKNIKANYNSTLTSNINLNDNFLLKNLNIDIGENLNIESSPQYTTNININLDNIYIDKWLTFINQISDKLTKTTSSKLESQVEQSSEDNQIFPANININSNAFWFNNYNFNGGTVNATIYPHELVVADINTPDVNGKVGYSSQENNLSISLKRLLLSSENNISINNQTDAHITAPMNDESGIILNTAESKNLVESTMLTSNESNLQIRKIESSQQESPISLSKNIKLPDILVKIKNLYINNAFLGEFNGNIYQQSNDLYFENINLKNTSSDSHLNAFIHCLFCDNDNNYKMASANIYTHVKDFGLLATKFDQGDMFKGGHGTININTYYDGDILNFNKENLTLYSNINIENGTLLKVKPGIIGTFMGVVSLGAISSVNSLNFNSLFGQSFPYNNLTSDFKISNDTVSVNNMTLNGDSAFIHSFGKYYMSNQQIDAYLTVEPKIGGTIATTAGIVTLNPIIGGIVYFAQKLIGDPINKLLSVNFKITGDIHNPEIKPTKLDEQILNNFKSSIQFIPTEEDN